MNFENSASGDPDHAHLRAVVDAVPPDYTSGSDPARPAILSMSPSRVRAGFRANEKDGGRSTAYPAVPRAQSALLERNGQLVTANNLAGPR